MRNHLELASHVNTKQGVPAAILVYGRNAMLLETRRWVLERAGLKVSTTTDFAEVEQLLTSQPIDVFVLCHTLSPEEGDSCLARASSLRPTMKKLVLTANTPLGILGPREPRVSAFEGPRALLVEVGKLLELDLSGVHLD